MYFKFHSFLEFEFLRGVKRDVVSQFWEKVFLKFQRFCVGEKLKN